MARAPDLTEIDASVEVETITFDYGRVLDSGVIINSATVTCSATQGKDGSASSRLVGVPVLLVSPSSGISGQAVAQQVGSMIAGEVYRLTCLANCSDGQKLSLWTHLPCNAIGP